MLDAALIAACIASKEAWERVSPHITQSDMGTPWAAFWWGKLTEWYARDPGAKAVDKALFVEQGRLSIKNEKHELALIDFITNLPDAVSPLNAAQTALELRRHNVGMELGQAIASQDHKSIQSLLPQFNELMAATSLTGRSKRRDALSLDELDSFVGAENKIPVAPSRVNDRLKGGALPGHHILVYGRPEVGKSTFVLNMSAGFLWSDQRVLYISTEDNENVHKNRMRSRLTGWTSDEVAANPKRANEIARDKGLEERMLITHLDYATEDALKEVIESFEPTVLILDQIRGLHTKGDGLTQSLEQAGVQVRNLLSYYQLVGVSVTQANDRSLRYGQKPPLFLGMADVDSSRTGLPGAVDVMIGVGVDDEHAKKGQRGISFPKNKLSSDPDSHDPIIVEFDTARSRVR